MLRIETAPSFHSRALKRTKARVPAAGRVNFEEAAAFHNELFGLQLALTERLGDTDGLDAENAAKRKQGLLLDALEDIANLNLGFRADLLGVVHKFRRRAVSPSSLYLESLDHRATDIDGLVALRALRLERIAEKEQELEGLTSEVSNLKAEFEEVKAKLFEDPDRFADLREARGTMECLQESYDRMFAPAEQADDEESRILTREIEYLRNSLARVQIELHVAKQITRRVSFMAKRKIH
jgi:hypothetical protein